jgi:ABC-2 type transport system permease protein
MISAEHLKLKHTFGRKLPVIAPVVTLLLALLLTGGMDKAFPAGAWNWWYIMLLPGMLGVLCYLCVKKDKKLKYYNILVLHLFPRKSWVVKNIYCALGLVISNFIIFLGTLIGGYLLGTTISVQDGFYGALLLSLSYLWEIPLLLFLSTKFGMFASTFTSIVLAVGGTITLADTNLWWTFPPSIPIRLMCPVLGILPNGLPIPIGSVLSNSNIILLGVIVSLIWFLGLTFFTAYWFQRMEVE